MAVPLTWPGKYHFYPIGSHSAQDLTRDFSPDQDANILLLPCGDLRNVLYTVFTETPSIPRKVDFTCCDYNAGILARNILLLAMIIDDVPTKIVWNVYLDMYLDDKAHAALAAQCLKLFELSETMETWRTSSYAPTLRMGTDLTLREVRRHWSLYLAAATAVDDRATTIHRLMDDGRKRVFDEFYRNANGTSTLSTGRSAGPLFLRALPIYGEHLRQYWQTGTTSFPLSAEAASESHTNPTFLYCKAGEIFAVHHDTDPLAPFHLSHVFGNHHDVPTPHCLTASALEELHNWCVVFRARAVTGGHQLVVRFIFGDALAVSQALQAQNEQATFQPNAKLAASAWSCEILQLNTLEYDGTGAPTRFEAIDTSNICDHIGLFNVLISSIPLLAESPPASSVLYTESFVALHKDSDPMQRFEAMLVADLATHSLLFGVAPLGALSGFTSQCDTHELQEWKRRDHNASQPLLQMITWKHPWTADSRAAIATRSPALFELSPAQLCALLLRIYDRLFHAENTFNPTDREAEYGAHEQPSGVGYTKETFILFIRFLRPRLCLTEAQWHEVLDQFLRQKRLIASAQNTLDGQSLQEINALLCQYHVLNFLEGWSPARSGRLSKWTEITPHARVYLSVPADRIAMLRQFASNLVTVPLHCVVQHPSAQFIFQSVHAVFGRVIDVGTPSNPAVQVLAEGGDASFSSTASPLVLSFIVPIATLLNDVAPEDVFIRLSVRTIQASIDHRASTPKTDVSVFSVCLEDMQHVHVVQIPLTGAAPFPPPPGSPAPMVSMVPLAIGRQIPVHVELGKAEVVAKLTARLLVENTRAKATFSGGAKPAITQTSPCTMRVSLGSQAQLLVFPVPVVGSQYKARLARQSSYIEVDVPVAIPAIDNLEGMKLDPFPLVRTGDGALATWNMHRVNLDQLPMLDTENPVLESWFNTHASTLFSEREGKMKRRERNMVPDSLTYLKDTIHYILNKVAGLPSGVPKRVFALRDNATNDSDTIFFVRGLRYDLSCDTVVCDAYVLPLFPEFMVTLRPWFSGLVNSEITNTRTFEGESAAWKQLLPAMVERCRAAWTHGVNCEYVAKGRIPLSTEVNGGDPLCSCGRGKDVEGMREVAVWAPFAPFVTRIALSPLFAASYMEHVLPRITARAWYSTDAGGIVPISLPGVNPLVGPPPAKLARQCKRCDKTGPDVKRCSRCGAVMYCSKTCQRADWKSHKPACATVARK